MHIATLETRKSPIIPITETTSENEKSAPFDGDPKKDISATGGEKIIFTPDIVSTPILVIYKQKNSITIRFYYIILSNKCQ